MLFLQRLFDQLSRENDNTEVDLSSLDDLSLFCDPLSCGMHAKDPVILEFLSRQMINFRDSGERIFIDNIGKILRLVRAFKVEPDLWELQNLYHDLREDPDFLKWLRPDTLPLFMAFGNELGFVSDEDGGSTC